MTSSAFQKGKRISIICVGKALKWGQVILQHKNIPNNKHIKKEKKNQTLCFQSVAGSFKRGDQRSTCTTCNGQSAAGGVRVTPTFEQLRTPAIYMIQIHK